MKRVPLSLHNSDVGRANLRTFFRAAKGAGFEYAEPTKIQLGYFLDAGYSTKDVKEMAGDLKLSAVSWLENCERQGYEYVAMMREAEKLFALSAEIGAEAIEVLSGPTDYRAVEAFRRGTPYRGYMGLQGLALREQTALTVRNLKSLCDLAAQFGLVIYFEPLCWTPISSPLQSVPICRQVERENMKIVFDFFHAYIGGVTADFIRTIEPELILGVHVCDSLDVGAGEIPVEPVLRNVRLGKGSVPVKEWVEAIKATGFEGWWAYETFSKEEAEEDPILFAKQIYGRLRELIG
ncbi:MAG: sugar phosphate isomerase/epimerase [Lachnospiraceae bacterium]|jgi:sugar phosphate isomerase/epimerase|nr:sugar phosphate isomerase/epimerase [Lachnospiraceae bacterium]